MHYRAELVDYLDIPFDRPTEFLKRSALRVETIAAKESGALRMAIIALACTRFLLVNRT